jgi:hypothetical protein
MALRGEQLKIRHLKIDIFRKRLKADFQSSHEAPRSSLRVHASN